jgi:hypothetical protein
MSETYEKLLKIVRKEQAKGEPVTIKSLARRLKLGQKATLELCEGSGLNVNIGLSTGSGYGVFDSIGEYSVEDLSL